MQLSDWCSGFFVPTAIIEADLTWAERLTFLLLARHANENNEAWPKVETLASELRVSRDTILRSITTLTDKGWLAVDRRGQGRSNVYTLKLQNATSSGENLQLLKSQNATSLNKRVHGKNTGKRAKALPARDDWLTDGLRKWAEGQISSPIDSIADQFTDYHTAKGSTMKDWAAAFRNWVRREPQFAGRRNEPKGWAGLRDFGEMMDRQGGVDDDVFGVSKGHGAANCGVPVESNNTGNVPRLVSGDKKPG